MDALLTALLQNSGVAQFPDVKLYNAAKMLTPDERPKVPVRLEDRDYKIRPVDGWVDFRTGAGTAYVNRQSPAYQKGLMPRLASIIAHEAVHTAGNRGEHAAYDREADVLRRLDPDGSKRRLTDIEKLKARFKK